MKNFLFGQNGLAAKIVHTRYLSRWIVMGCDVLISTGVTVFAYWFVRFVREETPAYAPMAFPKLKATCALAAPNISPPFE